MMQCCVLLHQCSLRVLLSCIVLFAHCWRAWRANGMSLVIERTVISGVVLFVLIVGFCMMVHSVQSGCAVV